MLSNRSRAFSMSVVVKRLKVEIYRWVILLFLLRSSTTHPSRNFKGSSKGKRKKSVNLFFCDLKVQLMDPDCKSFQPFLFLNGNRSIFLALAGVVNIWLPSSFYCVYPCCYYKTCRWRLLFFFKFRSLFYFFLPFHFECVGLNIQ